LINIVDYGSGNVTSVANAFEVLGYSAEVSRDSNTFKKSTHIVLPGVGAFGAGMDRLRELDLIERLEREVMEKGKPFLGICLGHQMLATIGLEFGEHEGLDWVHGRVERIDTDGSHLRLPHIGWNHARVLGQDPLYLHMPENPCFYFVHSYHLVPDDPSVTSAVSDYGVTLTASIQKQNIFGVQFHPEKSQSEGLQLLKNFAELD
jgi:glutamine amidotransferase